MKARKAPARNLEFLASCFGPVQSHRRADGRGLLDVCRETPFCAYPQGSWRAFKRANANIEMTIEREERNIRMTHVLWRVTRHEARKGARGAFFFSRIEFYRVFLTLAEGSFFQKGT